MKGCRREARVPGLTTFEGVQAHPKLRYMASNDAITMGFRRWYDLRSCLVSLFEVHNELLNVWTHLVGVVLFVWLCYRLAVSPGGAGKPRMDDLHTLHTLDQSSSQSQPYEMMYCDGMPAHIVDNFWHVRDGHHTGHALIATSFCYDSDAARLKTTVRSLRLDARREFQTFRSWARDGVGEIKRFFRNQSYVNPPLTHVSRWPMFVFMMSAVVCLACSTCYHLFMPLSESWAHFLLKMDGAGIATLVGGSFFPFIHYAFFCMQSWGVFYLVGISSLSLVVTTCTFMPWFLAPGFRAARLAMFLSLAAFAIFPIFHLIIYYGFWSENVQSWLPGMVRMGALYLIGGAMYAARFPEAWFPGKFDIVASSHQLFHTCVVLAAYSWYDSQMAMFHWRSTHMCPAPGTTWV